MARTNGCWIRTGVLVSVLFLFGCDAMMAPAGRIVAVGPMQRLPEAVPAAPVQCVAVPSQMTTHPQMKTLPDAPPLPPPVTPSLPDIAPASSPLGNAIDSDEPVETDSIALAHEDVEPDQVVHVATLHGRVTAYAGKRLTIEPLVSTSSTLPEVGSRAELSIMPASEGTVSDWLNFAEVELVDAVTFGEPFHADIVATADDPGAAAHPFETLSPGARVRLEWTW